jgi:hypothetical protein
MNKLKIGLIVDEEEQSYLNYNLYERSLESDKYSIEYLIIQKLQNNGNKIRFKSLISFLKRNGITRSFSYILFKLIDVFESKIVLNKSKLKNYFIKHKLSDFKTLKLYVDPAISKSGLVYRYKKEDIQNIEKLNLDLLIRGGRGILRGEILDICRLGVISFHHGNNDINRGGPPGFWEVFNREVSTGFIIQRLTNELDGGDVIFKGSIATSFFYKLNQYNIEIKSSFFLHQLCEKISNNSKEFGLYPKIPYAYPLYTKPNLGQIFSYLSRTFIHGLKKVLRKFFLRTHRWSVAFQSTKDWKCTVLWKSKVIKNPPHRFLADPFVVTENNQTILFVEDYDFRVSRGKISAYELRDSEFKELGVVLEEKFHLSYPFLFRAENCLYMIPETHECQEIRLYKCHQFPLKWKYEKTLIKEINTGDTSIFKHKNKWWLFTNKDSSELNDYSSELHIYYSDNFNSSNWQPHPLNPVIFNSTCARNGGQIISNDQIYRVYQKQGFDLYGESVGVSKITELTTCSYKEEKIFEIPPLFMKNIKGIHTYSYNSGIVVFDFLKFENSKK